MHPTVHRCPWGSVIAHTGGYVAVHHHGHSSHGPVPTIEDAARVLEHMGRTGLWPKQVTA